jgi:hypothetical protein
MKQHNAERGCIVEDSCGQPQPKYDVMQGNRYASYQWRSHAPKDCQQRDKNEDLEVRFDHAIARIDTQAGDAHRRNCKDDTTKLRSSVMEQDNGGPRKEKNHDAGS